MRIVAVKHLKSEFLEAFEGHADLLVALRAVSSRYRELYGLCVRLDEIQPAIVCSYA